MEDSIIDNYEFNGEDVVEVMDAVEKCIILRNRESLDLAMIPLVVAELALLNLESEWPYSIDVKESIQDMRKLAKFIAIKITEDYKKYQTKNGID